MIPPARGNFRERLKTRLRAKVRAWITGHQIVHWDEGDDRLTWDHPTYPIIRTMRAYPGEPGEMHIGRYSGFHYTALLIPGGLHHTDWVGTLHAHVDENDDWVFHDGSVFSKGPITIGNDCYIGYEAIVTSGVTIGDGAVVAARAVVTKDVEPYSIIAGNPGQHVRYRFDEPTREALLRIKWWDWSNAKVAVHRDQISSPNVKEFVEGHDPELGDPSCEVCRSGAF
jgi:hypothetical protein